MQNPPHYLLMIFYEVPYLLFNHCVRDTVFTFRFVIMHFLHEWLNTFLKTTTFPRLHCKHLWPNQWEISKIDVHNFWITALKLKRKGTDLLFLLPLRCSEVQMWWQDVKQPCWTQIYKLNEDVIQRNLVCLTCGNYLSATGALNCLHLWERNKHWSYLNYHLFGILL